MEYLDLDGLTKLVAKLKSTFVDKGIHISVSTLNAGASATASYNSETNTLSLGIPKGAAGSNGSGVSLVHVAASTGANYAINNVAATYLILQDNTMSTYQGNANITIYAGASSGSKTVSVTSYPAGATVVIGSQYNGQSWLKVASFGNSGATYNGHAGIYNSPGSGNFYIGCSASFILVKLG